MTDYWKECVSEAFDEAQIKASDNQIATVAEWVSSAHEYYGMAHGHECIPNPLSEENKRLTQELKRERDKIICRECNGYGRIITRCGTLESESDCFNCRGRGFLYT